MPHIHDKIDFVTDVFVVHDNKVLLRRHDKYKIWLGVGGHVELDEDPNEAAVREAKEEVGLNISLAGHARQRSSDENGKDLIPPAFINRHRINDTHEHISLIYFATTDNAEINQGETEVSDEIRWFTRDELEDPKFGVIEKIRVYARKALEELAS